MKDSDRLRRSTKVRVTFEGIVINHVSRDGVQDGYRISVKDPTQFPYSWWAVVPANCVEVIE